MSDHEASEGEEVEGLEGGCESFVVAGQAAEAGGPGEASLHHLSSRQQHETAFGLGMLDGFQLNTMLACRRFCRLSRVALIHIGQLDILFGDLLHLPGQFAGLCAVLLIGRRHIQGQQMIQCIHGRMNLRSFAPLGPIVACPRARLIGDDERSDIPLIPKE